MSFGRRRGCGRWDREARAVFWKFVFLVVLVPCCAKIAVVGAFGVWFICLSAEPVYPSFAIVGGAGRGDFGTGGRASGGFHGLFFRYSSEVFGFLLRRWY